MQPEDRIRIRHMIEAGEIVGDFLSGKNRNDLESDRLLLFALVRAIEIMGEAAAKISPAARAMAPDLPWSLIVAMRNRLVHAYFDIDRGILWQTAAKEIPDLLSQLRALLDRD